ncbi:MAG: hypothetical protein LBU22_04050 [Dysgonamonadaceae bacterium]|jgi:hypothetical protein|nr:hypothetical protein [Dysgonamonadaceae bacterium]
MEQKEIVAPKKTLTAKEEKKTKRLSKIGQYWLDRGNDKGKIINMRAVLK